MNLHFTLEFYFKYLKLFSVQIGEFKNVILAINTKMKCKTVMAYVLENTQNLVILYRCFAKGGYEMYLKIYEACAYS